MRKEDFQKHVEECKDKVPARLEVESLPTEVVAGSCIKSIVVFLKSVSGAKLTKPAELGIKLHLEVTNTMVYSLPPSPPINFPVSPILFMRIVRHSIIFIFVFQTYACGKFLAKHNVKSFVFSDIGIADGIFKECGTYKLHFKTVPTDDIDLTLDHEIKVTASIFSLFLLVSLYLPLQETINIKFVLS